MSGDRCGSEADSAFASVLFPQPAGQAVAAAGCGRYRVRRRRCERRALILE